MVKNKLAAKIEKNYTNKADFWKCFFGSNMKGIQICKTSKVIRLIAGDTAKTGLPQSNMGNDYPICVLFLIFQDPDFRSHPNTWD